MKLLYYFDVILIALVVIAECSDEKGRKTKDQGFKPTVIAETSDEKVGEGYEPTGDHFLGSPDQFYQNPNLGFITGFKEFEDLFQKQDATSIANKMTEDVSYIHWEKGRLTGRKAVEKAYNEWFEAGKAGMTYELLGCPFCSGLLRKGVLYAFFRAHYFDKDDVNIENTFCVWIGKEVPNGFETQTGIEMKESQLFDTST